MAVGITQLFGVQYKQTSNVKNDHKVKSKKSEFSELMSSGKIASSSAQEAPSIFNRIQDTYEKSEVQDPDEAVNAVRQNINKISAEDRAQIVSDMKAEQDEQQKALVENVMKSVTSQASTFLNARAVPTLDENGFWRFIAGGNYPVDAETKVQAQNAISVDGFYGVAKTSQRLFDFASALAGDDADKMKEMQEGIARGFKEAEKAWGKELPSISQDTLKATNKLFDDYYNTKNQETTGSVQQSQQAVEAAVIGA